MKKKILSVTLGCMLAAGLLAGCGSTSGSDSESEDTGSVTAETSDTESASVDSDEEIKVQVVLKTLSSEYWGYVQAGAEAYGEEHPEVTVDVVGPSSETDFDTQQNMIETVLNSGEYDGLVLGALQSDTAVTLLSGTTMPVVAVDTQVNCDEVLAYVGISNEEAARQGAVAAVEAAEEAGWEEINAICIAGVQGAETAEARLTGFEEGITEAGGTFLSDETQYADYVADKAVTSMEAIMQNHPEGVAIILCSNDDMAVAAAAAAQGNAAYENTIFLGFDASKAGCGSMIDGIETMSVSADVYGMGYYAVETCVAAIRGEEVDDVDIECTIVTQETAQERLDELNALTAD